MNAQAKPPEPPEGKKAAPKKPKKVAFALQGGGSFGAFTWGVLDAFLEDGNFEIDGLSGTSAGGMNAVALAQGLLKGGNKGGQEEMLRFWHKVSDAGLLTPYFRPFSPIETQFQMPHYDPLQFFMGLMQGVMSPYQVNPANINTLRDLVEDFFDFRKLQAAEKLKLFLCATHVNTGRLKLFTLNTLTPDKILASACLPFLFQAVEIDGEHYWDGGFVGNPAIYPLIYDCEAPDIIVIQLSVMNRNRLPVTASEISQRHKEITYNACLMREMRMIDFVTGLIDQGAINDPAIRRINLHVIRNEDLFKGIDIGHALNPNWDLIQFLRAEGRATAQKWLKENGDQIGQKKKTEKDAKPLHLHK